jgi:hypothetical protein
MDFDVCQCRSRRCAGKYQNLARLHLDFADKDSRISSRRKTIKIIPATNLDAMHAVPASWLDEEDNRHVAELEFVRPRFKSHYTLLVSALIRRRSPVWPALASISPSTPSCRLPLLRCSDDLQSIPHNLRDPSPRSAFFRGTWDLLDLHTVLFLALLWQIRVVSAMTM